MKSNYINKDGEKEDILADNIQKKRIRSGESKVLINDNIWKFPSNIKYYDVPYYLKKFDGQAHDQIITFDLSHTSIIHSSFIGFLIHAKRKIDSQKGQLKLIISKSIEDIFSMLNLNDYLVK